MQGFRSAGGLQRFTSIFSAARNLFVPFAGKHPAFSTHLHRLAAFGRWRSVAGLAAAAWEEPRSSSSQTVAVNVTSPREDGSGGGEILHFWLMKCHITNFLV